MSWIHNPSIKDIHPRKLEIITELVKNADGKPITQSLPYLIQANKTLQQEGLMFTKEETGLIMDILTKDMSPKEKQQIEKMKSLINFQMKN